MLMDLRQRILTERLKLRPLVPADADEMAGVLADPSIYTFIGGAPPTVDELRQLYRRWSAGGPDDESEEWFNWAVCRQDDGGAIGWAQATITEGGSTATVAWVIGTTWQRSGFGSEAAAALVRWLTARGVSTVVAHVHPDHTASATVARRAGLLPTTEVHDGETVWRLSGE